MSYTITVVNETPIVCALINKSSVQAVTEEAVRAGFESVASE